MITLEGKLRRLTELEIKGEKRAKLTVEYEIPRYDGSPDLKLGEFFLPPNEAQGLKEGTDVRLLVRPYVSGKDVAFSAVGVTSLGGPKAA